MQQLPSRHLLELFISFPGGYLRDEARQDVRAIIHSALNRETDISESLNIRSTLYLRSSFEYYFLSTCSPLHDHRITINTNSIK